MKAPGKNSVWIKEMSKLEVHIIQDSCFSICSKKLENYWHSPEKREEKHSSFTTLKKVTFSQDKTLPRNDEILDKIEESLTIVDINMSIPDGNSLGNTVVTILASSTTEQDNVIKPDKTITGDSDVTSNSQKGIVIVKESAMNKLKTKRKQTLIVNDTTNSSLQPAQLQQVEDASTEK